MIIIVSQKWLFTRNSSSTLSVPGHVWAGSVLLRLSWDWTSKAVHTWVYVLGTTAGHHTHCSSGVCLKIHYNIANKIPVMWNVNNVVFVCSFCSHF